MQTVDDFLIERAQLAKLVLQHLLNVVAPETAQVVKTNKAGQIKIAGPLSNEFEQRRLDQIAQDAGARRKGTTANLALLLCVFRHIGK